MSDDGMTDRAHESGAAGRIEKREQGVALLVAVMMLSIMGLIGLSSMESVMRDRQVAGFQSRARSALYAADGGVAWGRGIIFEQVELLVPEGIAALHAFDPAYPDEKNPKKLGDGSISNPSFMKNPDPAIGQAIDYIGAGESCEKWIMSDEYGNAQWREALFSINTEGRTAEASNAARRIEATSTYCYPYF
jgi:hypothetical protein